MDGNGPGEEGKWKMEREKKKKVEPSRSGPKVMMRIAGYIPTYMPKVPRM